MGLPPFILGIKKKTLNILLPWALLNKKYWIFLVFWLKVFTRVIRRLFTTVFILLKNEVARVKSNSSSWSLFWLATTTAVVTCITIVYAPVTAEKIIYLHRLDSQIILVGGVATFFLTIGLISFVIRPIELIGKQSLHNKPSWVFYLFWSVANSLLLLTTLSIWNQSLDQTLPGHWTQYLVIVVVVICVKWFLEILTNNSTYYRFLNFASGSIGLDGDKLGFSASAKNSAEGLFNLSDYVNVVGLYGGFGFGKSSYARMIIESLDNKRVLYTYISLTETNEAKDFSKLFAERWLETLSVRYPKIDITSYLPYMDSILRESGNGIVSEILKAIASLNRGLVKTKAKFFDHYYEPKNINVSDRVAKLFGNINDIEENLWVVMVDEIERGQFDEIYRIIEIVERFKSEGRSGLPVKLLFLFCISEPELKEYLETFANSEPRVHLIKTFFYEDPKSITSRIFLPPVDPETKLKYVLDLLNQFTDREEIKVLDEKGSEVKDISANTIGDPSWDFKEHKDALGYVVGMLQESSPRTIGRVRSALELFYTSFKDRSGVLDKSSIRFSDILALEYIKIKYPYLIDFFSKTVYILVNQSDSRGMSSYFIKKEFEEKKLDLIGWIEQVTEIKVPETEKEMVKNLIGLVAYSYLDLLGKNYERDSKYRYVGSTSYPEVMADYLTLLSDGTQTSYRKNNRLYQKHNTESGATLVASLTNEELISYARFLFDVGRATPKQHLDVAVELSERMVSQKISVSPINVDDTTLNEATYQFEFQLTALVEKEKETIDPSDVIITAYACLKSVLTSKDLPTGIKFMLLNSLANSERGGGGEIHFRLENTFKRFLKYYDSDLHDLIKGVFKEGETRYLTGNEVLYETEENFFFTLYQGWSGSASNMAEIEKIRNAAKRKLEKYPDAIRLYWRKYPVGEGWTSLSDVFDADHFFSMHDTNNPIYMPLETLLEVTKASKIDDEEIQEKIKFWESIKDDPKLKELSAMKDDHTLKSFLLQNGFL